jgi:hypothetical protein
MAGDLAASPCDACCHSKNVSGGAIGHADKRPAAVAGAISTTFCRFSNFTQTPDRPWSGCTPDVWLARQVLGPAVFVCYSKVSRIYNFKGLSRGNRRFCIEIRC